MVVLEDLPLIAVANSGILVDQLVTPTGSIASGPLVVLQVAAAVHGAAVVLVRTTAHN